MLLCFSITFVSIIIVLSSDFNKQKESLMHNVYIQVLRDFLDKVRLDAFQKYILMISNSLFCHLA